MVTTHELPAGGQAAKVSGSEVLEEDVWSRRTSIRLAPDSAANADGDRGRLPFGTASSVSDNRPASSVSRGLELDTRSRVKSLRSRSADSVPVTSTATAVHAADAADAAASSVKDTGCRRRDGYVSVSRHHYSSERASTRGWGSGRKWMFYFAFVKYTMSFFNEKCWVILDIIIFYIRKNN